MDLNSISGHAQIAAFIAFVASHFLLYRLLVHQKDATIEQKNATIEMLERRATQPDLVARGFHDRIQRIEEELSKLRAIDDNADLIREKETQLSEARRELADLRIRSHRASNYFQCPHCEAAIGFREIGVDYDPEILLEWITYECGRATLNGVERLPCGTADADLIQYFEGIEKPYTKFYNSLTTPGSSLPSFTGFKSWT